MSIISIGLIAVVTSVIALSIRRYNSELSFVLAIAGSILILITVIFNVSTSFDYVKSIFNSADIKSEYIAIIVKVIGICFLTEFAADSCMDAGQRALAGNVTLAGKILVIISALPMYKDILDTVMSITGGAA